MTAGGRRRMCIRRRMTEGVLIAAVAVLASMAPPSGGSKQATILLTMGNYGYIDACSCGHEALGGLSRRATVLDELRTKHPGVLLLDGGDLVRLDTQEPAVRTIIQTMETMQYDGVRVGVFDARNQWAGRMMQASGLTLFEPNLKPTLFERNGVRIAVFDVPLVKPLSEFPFEELTPKIGLAFTEARKQADVIVAFTQMPAPETEQFVNALNQANQGPDILVTDTLDSPQLKQVGSILEVNSGVNGKYISVFAIEVQPGGRPTITHESVPVLLDTIGRPDIEAVLTKYREDVEVGLVVQQLPEFQSSEDCASCHTEVSHTSAYASWKQTRHSHALQTLKDDATNPPKGSAARSPQCLTCHLGSYRRFQVIDRRSVGVECITCHGTDSHTGKRPFVPEAVCLDCHDKDNSPNFDFAAYTTKIRHWDDAHDAEFQQFIADERTQREAEAALIANTDIQMQTAGAGAGVTGVLMIGFMVVVLLVGAVVIYRVAFVRRRN